MPKSKKSNSFKIANKATLFYDYKPAELRIGVQWLIVYYFKHPISKEFIRVRLTVPKVTSKRERKKLGQSMVIELNNKLSKGWLPIYDNKNSEAYRTIDFCIDLFLEFAKKDIQAGNKRPDTLRAYNSYFNMIKLFIAKKTTIKMMFEFNRTITVKYLDFIFYERKNIPRTYNNHLSFLNLFANFCLDRGFILKSFVSGISKKKEFAKKRKTFNLSVKEYVKQIESKNKYFYTLCMATYYCFIRRTELTKLKVKDINLKENYIFISGSISKNRKDDYVTIPKAFLPLLIDHLRKAKKSDFVFSGYNFQAGEKKLDPKKITDTWKKYQRFFGFANKYQFYSLKDTGITEMLQKGVPAIIVRDQARHHDIRITEGYTARNIKANKTILDLDFKF
jgi:integrase